VAESLLELALRILSFETSYYEELTAVARRASLFNEVA